MDGLSFIDNISIIIYKVVLVFMDVRFYIDYIDFRFEMDDVV